MYQYKVDGNVVCLYYYYYIPIWVYDWLILDWLGVEILRTHEEEGFADLIVMAHHQPPKLAPQFMLECEYCFGGADITFFRKVL